VGAVTGAGIEPAVCGLEVIESTAADHHHEQPSTTTD